MLLKCILLLKRAEKDTNLVSSFPDYRTIRERGKGRREGFLKVLIFTERLYKLK